MTNRKKQIAASPAVIFAMCFVAAAFSGCGAPTNSKHADVCANPVIISFLPSATECAYALGLGPNMAGRSKYCDYPAEAASLPICGDMLAFNTSEILKLKPSHAIVADKNAPAIPLLKTIGTKIIIAKTASVRDILDFMRSLGILFPSYTNGAFRTIENDFRPLLTPNALNASRGSSVLLSVSSGESPWDGCFAAGGNTFYEDVIEAAGFSNVCAALTGYPEVSPEFLLKQKPEFIIDVSGRDLSNHGTNWKKLPLPEETSVIYITNGFAKRPGPRLPQFYRKLSEIVAYGQDTQRVGE